MSSTSSVRVTGMTCGHCVTAITSELTQLPGVRDVTVDLVTGGTSTVHVTSDTALDPAAVRDAIDEAGYEIAPDTP